MPKAFKSLPESNKSPDLDTLLCIYFTLSPCVVVVSLFHLCSYFISFSLVIILHMCPNITLSLFLSLSLSNLFSLLMLLTKTGNSHSKGFLLTLSEIQNQQMISYNFSLLRESRLQQWPIIITYFYYLRILWPVTDIANNNCTIINYDDNIVLTHNK